MHKNFEAIAIAAKGIETKGTGLFGMLIGFAIEMLNMADVKAGGVEALTMLVKDQERMAGMEKGIKLGSNSTYKSAKSVILNAVEAELSLTNVKGKPKGKTELQDELAALKVPSTPAEKFRKALENALKLVEKLDKADVVTAASLSNDLNVALGARLKAEA